MKAWDSGFDRTGLEDEPTGALLGELVSEAKRLVRDEVKIAKAEIREDVKEASGGASLLALSAVIGQGAFLAFVAAAILLLSFVVDVWLAAAAVGMVLFASAGFLAAIGRARLAKVGLNETIAKVKEDGQWASETMRAARANRHGIA